jgi:hypothetical protein
MILSKTSTKPKSLQIVCYKRGWILEAIAVQWRNFLSSDARCSECSLVYGSPEPGYDIYVHFIWFDAVPVDDSINIMYVTHIDHWWKAIKLIQLARMSCKFVCMSSQTRTLINKYIASDSTRYIRQESLHFGSINNGRSEPLTFGMFFRIQEDGRKSNKDILNVLKFANDNADCCHLILFGDGYSELIRPYEKIVASVYSADFDRINYQNQMEKCDYILYFGFDEGAISILDAATLGIPVLATSQGYHLDLLLPKGSLLFDNSAKVVDAVISASLSAKAKCNSLEIDSVMDTFPNACQRPSLLHYVKVFFIKNIFIANTKHLIQDIKVILKMFFGKK